MLIWQAVGIGLLIGAVVGLLGAGGGILAVPVLIYLLQQNAYDAAAGSLFIVGLTALVALIAQLKSGKMPVACRADLRFTRQLHSGAWRADFTFCS